MCYVKPRAISHNRQKFFTTVTVVKKFLSIMRNGSRLYITHNSMSNFKTPKGLKKDIYAIVLSIAPIHWIFTRTVLNASCRWQRKIGQDFRPINQISHQIYARGLPSIFSNVHEANFWLRTLLNNFWNVTRKQNYNR